MRSVCCAFLLLAVAGCCASAATPVIVTDFEADNWPRVTNNPRAQGVLPARWSDNSNWAQVWTEYSREQEESAFLRIRVTRIDDGWGQIQHSMPRITEAGYYRLAVRLRSADDLAVGMGIRRAGSPYNYLWQTNLVEQGRWRDLTFYIRLTPADYDIGFYILMNGVGVLDLAVFRLEKLSEEEVLTSGPSGAAPLGKNLLRNTRFPLGLQSGWMLDRDASDGDEVVVETDASVTGPSGAGSGGTLRLRSPKQTRLYSEPFGVPAAGRSYTASAWFRGSGAWRLAVVSDGRVVTQRSFTATANDWQRASVTFTVPLLARASALRIEGMGELWIDAVQVEEGSAATAYAGGGPCEVALATASTARIQFEDEEPALRFRVSGDAETCRRLRARVVDLYGGDRELTPVSLEGANAGELAFPVTAARSYGLFRIEASVENDAGERVSPFNELVVTRLRKPLYWMADAPDSPFGVHTNPSARHLLMAKAAGVNWTRLHDAGLQYIGWYHLERQQGVWTFFDAEIERYRRFGIKILGELGTAPEWASHFDKPRNSYFDRFYQPKDLNEYARYVRTVTTRYHGVIDAWDVWNEPWNAGWWAVRYDEANQRYVTSDQPQADFAKLQRVAYETAKSVDPALTVLGINSTTGSVGTSWTRGVVEAGGLEWCDAAVYHQYTNESLGHENDTVERGWKSALEPAFDENGSPHKPSWMTEGSPVNGDGVLGAGFYRHTLPFEDRENYSHTSDRVARYLVSHLAQGNRKIFLYSMHTHTHFAETQSPWRVLVDAGGYPHPNLAAHSSVAWLLEGRRFVKRFVPPASPRVPVYLFENEDGAVAVLAPRRGQPAGVDLPALDGVEWMDLYGNRLDAGTPVGQTVIYAIRPGGKAADLERELVVLAAKLSAPPA